MSMKKNYSSICMFINCIFFLAEIVFLFNIWPNSEFEVSWSYYAFFMTTMSVLLNIVYFVIAKIYLSDFRIMFVLLSYVFLFGRVWLNHIFPEVQLYWALEDQFAENIMMKAAVFAACCVQGMFCGLFLAERKKGSAINDCDDSEANIDIDTALQITGIIMLCIAIPCRIYLDISSIIDVRSTGDYSNAVAGSGLYDDFANFLVPGIICLVESKYLKKWKILFIVFSAYMVFAMAISGDRRYSVSAILVMAVYYLRKKEIDNVNKLKLLPLALIGIFFVNFLDVVRETRLEISEEIFSALVLSKLFDFSGIFIDFFTEFGISFFSLVAIVTHIPDIIDFQYGMTFVYTLPSVLPIGFLLGDWFRMASPSNIINTTISLPVGATLVGDMYANFGVMIALFFPLVGAVITKILKPVSKYDYGMRIVIYYTKYFWLINLVRCSVFEIFRGVVWGIVIPSLIYKIVKTSRNTIYIYRR